MALSYTPMIHGFGNVIIVDPEASDEHGFISNDELLDLDSSEYVSISTNGGLTWEKVAEIYELDDYSQKQILIGFRPKLSIEFLVHNEDTYIQAITLLSYFNSNNLGNFKPLMIFPKATNNVMYLSDDIQGGYIWNEHYLMNLSGDIDIANINKNLAIGSTIKLEFIGAYPIPMPVTSTKNFYEKYPIIQGRKDNSYLVLNSVDYLYAINPANPLYVNSTLLRQIAKNYNLLPNCPTNLLENNLNSIYSLIEYQDLSKKMALATMKTFCFGSTDYSSILTKSNIKTVTNKTLTNPKINSDIEVSATSTEINVLAGLSTEFGNHSPFYNLKYLSSYIENKYETTTMLEDVFDNLESKIKNIRIQRLSFIKEGNYSSSVNITCSVSDMLSSIGKTTANTRVYAKNLFIDGYYTSSHGDLIGLKKIITDSSIFIETISADDNEYLDATSHQAINLSISEDIINPTIIITCNIKEI